MPSLPHEKTPMRALFLLLMLLSLAACQGSDLTFAAIPWGADSAHVRELMAERGFAFVAPANAEGDHLYAGPYAGRKAVVVARMAEGRIAKIEVGLKPDAEDRLALFRELERRLEEEYGRERGTARVEDEAAPVAWQPNGPADAALRSVWARRSRTGESFLILEDRPELAIVIAFESPSWHQEFLRRQPGS